MTEFIQGADRNQGYLLPERIDEYVTEENPVRVIEAFVEELDLGALGFVRVAPNEMGRPAYHPATLLKIYLYGYLNRVQSSRRLEQERNAIWSSCGSRVAWLQTSKRSRTSGPITVRRSEECAASLSFCAGE